MLFKSKGISSLIKGVIHFSTVTSVMPACTVICRFLRHVDWVVVMEGGRVDEEHSGPPERVLPWLQENMTQTGKEAVEKGTTVDGKNQGHSSEVCAPLFVLPYI